jgi:hypothetical protein
MICMAMIANAALHCTGKRRQAVQLATLQQLSKASPMKEKALLHRQLAALQEDLQAKQAQITAQRKDLEYRQHLLQYAAGLCICPTVGWLDLANTAGRFTHSLLHAALKNPDLNMGCTRKCIVCCRCRSAGSA